MADSDSTDEVTPIVIDVLANDSDPDGDPLSVIEVDSSAVTVGSTITTGWGAAVTLNADGSLTYDPDGAFAWVAAGDTGDDSFSYTVSDGNGGTDTGRRGRSGVRS